MIAHTCITGPLCEGWANPADSDDVEDAGPDCLHPSCWGITNSGGFCGTVQQAGEPRTGVDVAGDRIVDLSPDARLWALLGSARAADAGMASAVLASAEAWQAIQPDRGPLSGFDTARRAS
jgi:hypothetical protein